MKAFQLAWPVLLIVALGSSPAQDAAKEKDQAQQTATALEAIRKALADLPPGAETDQIKKSLERLQSQLKDLQGRVTLAEADLAMWRERMAWSERMAKKGFLTNQQAQADRARFNSAEIALQKVQEEFKKFLGDPKKRPEK